MGLQHGAGHALYLVQHALQPLPVIGRNRGNPEPEPEKVTTQIDPALESAINNDLTKRGVSKTRKRTSKKTTPKN